MNPKRPRSPDGDAPNLTRPQKVYNRHFSFHLTKLSDIGSEDTAQEKMPMTMMHTGKNAKAAKVIWRKTERSLTGVHTATDEQLEGATITRKSARNKRITNYSIDDAYLSMGFDVPREEAAVSTTTARNETQHNVISQVEETDDWDTDDETLLNRSWGVESQLYRICQEKYGLVPDQLLPDGEYMNGVGPGLYTRNWSEGSAKDMLSLLHCPLFQKEPALLQYAISLAMCYRLPTREKPCDDVLFVSPGVYRMEAFAFVEKLHNVVEDQNWVYVIQRPWVLSRDLSAVVASWDRWVVGEASRVREWNKSKFGHLEHADQLIKKLKDYQDLSQYKQYPRKGPEFGAPLKFKKKWIVDQRKKYPRPQKNALLNRVGKAKVPKVPKMPKEQEHQSESRLLEGEMNQDGVAGDKYIRTAPNSISYLDLTVDSDDEENDHEKKNHEEEDNEEEDNFWDAGDEILLRKSSPLNVCLFKLCHEIFGLMPDQLLPDEKFVTEGGGGSYTANWSESITKAMTLLVFCPIFQKDAAFLKYTISLAMHYRLPGQGRPLSKILFEASEGGAAYRFKALGFVKNIKRCVENIQVHSTNTNSAVVLRDLSAVVQSWNTWVAAKRVSIEEWNLEHLDDLRYPEYEALENYQKDYTKSLEGEEKSAALRLKKAWIISQRRDVDRNHDAELDSEYDMGSGVN